MSGDRLAQIEMYWNSDAVVTEPHGLVRDVLALIEIAKAARDIDDEFMGHEELEPLRSALARLDSGGHRGDA